MAEAALSDYAESGLLNYIFRGGVFNKPTTLAIALCSGDPEVNELENRPLRVAADLPELPQYYADGTTATRYARYHLGYTADSGNVNWKFTEEDYAAGSGVIKNCFQIDWPAAEYDPDDPKQNIGWGWVSGVAILDSDVIGEGNIIMASRLDNPRFIYAGDSLKFEIEALQISFK